MKDIKKIYIILIIILVILMGISFTLKKDGIQNIITNINIQEINIINRTINGIKNIDNFILTYQENNVLKKENKILIEENKNLRGLIIELGEKIEVLEIEMNISEKILIKKNFIYAPIIYRSNSSWNDFLVIGKGKKDNIEVGDIVTNNGYLVGKIIEVDKNSSKIEFFTTNNNINTIGINIDTTQGDVPCIIDSYNPYKKEIVITPLVEAYSAKINDVVYTNGMDGNYPQGIKIGEIKTIEIDDETNKMKIIVNLGANFSNLEIITVIKWNMY